MVDVHGTQVVHQEKVPIFEARIHAPCQCAVTGAGVVAYDTVLALDLKLLVRLRDLAAVFLQSPRQPELESDQGSHGDGSGGDNDCSHSWSTCEEKSGAKAAEKGKASERAAGPACVGVNFSQGCCRGFI